MIIDTVKKFVEDECKKPTSKYGYDPFVYHFVPMVKYATRLADDLDADKEIITIAAWLHDIGSIIYGRSDHHITSTKVAEKLLKKLKYPPERIDWVKKCILNHRGSIKNECESLEEKIISDADAISNFDNLSGIFEAAFVYENLSRGEAQVSVYNKLQNKWGQLYFDKSKELIRPRYEAAMLLLK